MLRRIQRLPRRLGRRFRRWREPIWRDGWATFELAGERLLFRQAHGIDWWADEVRRGRYEPAALDQFARSLSNGDVVLDVGAWIGAYSLVASRRVGAAGRVFAFEPNPASRTLLEANLERNGARNVTVVAAAVSGRPGRVWLRRAGREYSPETSSGREEADVEVPAVALASFCADREVSPDVIKVDVEGAEAEVLSESAAEIVRGARLTLVEIHRGPLRDRGMDPAVLLDRFARWGLTERELERRSRDNRMIVLGPGAPG